jgi:hypothetical protein
MDRRNKAARIAACSEREKPAAAARSAAASLPAGTKNEGTGCFLDAGSDALFRHVNRQEIKICDPGKLKRI